MKKFWKKFFIVSSIIIGLLIVNQIVYLTSVQFTCHKKIQDGKELNFYQIASAWQTHLSCCFVGWFIEPHLAEICFYKQFHIKPKELHLTKHISIAEDDTLRTVKSRLKNGQSDRLAWHSYSPKSIRTSILLNGSTITKKGDHYHYSIPCDYLKESRNKKIGAMGDKGTIEIMKIPISETVFDYLERKNILSVFTVTYIE